MTDIQNFILTDGMIQSIIETNVQTFVQAKEQDGKSELSGAAFTSILSDFFATHYHDVFPLENSNNSESFLAAYRSNTWPQNHLLTSVFNADNYVAMENTYREKKSCHDFVEMIFDFPLENEIKSTEKVKKHVSDKLGVVKATLLFKLYLQRKIANVPTLKFSDIEYLLGKIDEYVTSESATISINSNEIREKTSPIHLDKKVPYKNLLTVGVYTFGGVMSYYSKDGVSRESSDPKNVIKITLDKLFIPESAFGLHESNLSIILESENIVSTSLILN